MSDHPSDGAPSAKQLVFLFMAATVVAVVVFLCGVLVGRGVPPPRAADGFAGAADLGDLPETFVAPAAVGSGARAEDLSYFRRLEAGEPVPEVLRTPPAPVDDEPTPAPVPPPPVTAAGPDATPMAAPAEPAGPDDGFTVQVAALRGRPEADQIAADLIAKGYDAYVIEPAPGAPAAVYRVRVGRALSREDAEDTLRRLETQEQFKPWITR